MAVRNLPSWVAVWLCITSTTCTIDALFVLLRPHTLPGGKWNYLFRPYNLYIEVDPMYKDTDDAFGIAQSLWLVSVSAFSSSYTLTGYTVAMETSEVKRVTETYSAIIGHLCDTIIAAATDKDLLYYPVKVMNLVEVCINIITLIMHVRGKSAGAVLLAFMVSVMTLAKTVLYILICTPLCGGQHFVNYPDLQKLILAFVFPNSFWIVVPFLCVMATGRIMLECMGNGETKGKKLKTH